ncbi:MAG: hypothetical protein HN961_08425, partial [Planctomycetes bacterium]|nr:hypothetical protein [Planctomycetota bacterium]
VRALAEVVVLAGLLMVEPEIALFLSIVLYIFIPPLLHAPFLFRANSEEAAHES